MVSRFRGSSRLANNIPQSRSLASAGVSCVGARGTLCLMGNAETTFHLLASSLRRSRPRLALVHLLILSNALTQIRKRCTDWPRMAELVDVAFSSRLTAAVRMQCIAKNGASSILASFSYCRINLTRACAEVIFVRTDNWWAVLSFGSLRYGRWIRSSDML